MSETDYLEGNTTAVYIKDLCKSYDSGHNDKELILNKFCMRVKKGSIYGFLGASGCGKTTVLSCIVGLRKWDSGQVMVFGREPGSKESGIPGRAIGYMPQDLALYNQLSILEIMEFYGRLYSMHDLEIRKQSQVLSELLELSNIGSKLVGKLSGGQKRRASLAVALVHSPQLIVLDEPTVGLDPVLREKYEKFMNRIWNYLYQIAANSGATIIITTHYIEEARYSDMIGLMRHGRMLVEESPRELLKYYESDLLEQVVIQICRSDQVKPVIASDTAENRKTKLLQSEKLTFKSSWKQENVQTVRSDELDGKFNVLPPDDFDNGYHRIQSWKEESGLHSSNFLQSLKRTCGLTWVIFLTFFRHPVFLLMIVMMPAIQGSLSLWAIGSKPIGLPFGIVNHEVRNWKTACESTNSHSYIERELTSSCQLSFGMKQKNLSCRYLNQLQNDTLVNLIFFSGEEEARAQVDLGNSWGYMIISENFSQSFGDLLLAKQYSTNESIEGSRIPIYLDYSQYVSSFFIVRNIYTSYWNFIKEVAKSCSTDEKTVDFPLNFRKPIFGDNEDNYTAFVMPGLLIFTIFGMVCTLSALLLINDRREGTLRRATVAGLSCFNVILSHLIVQGILTLAQLAIWNTVLHFIFSIPFNGQAWLYVLICLLTGLSGSTWGIFLGILVDTEVKALHIGTFCCYILLLYGGIIWPPEAMTQFWQTVASILPTYLPTHSLRSVIIKNAGIEHSLVWPGILASVVWTIGFGIFSVLIYRKRT